MLGKFMPLTLDLVCFCWWLISCNINVSFLMICLIQNTELVRFDKPMQVPGQKLYLCPLFKAGLDVVKV